MPSPTVSVVVPTYNRAGYVVEAVESVLAQTFRDLEVIVVDDGSTDGTAKALAPYLDRIRYVRQENRGLAAARNRGIREATGEFVAFLDSDDRFEPGLLRAVLATFEAHPDAGAVFPAEREIDPDGRRRDRVHTKRSPGPYFTPASMVGKDTGVGCGRPPVVRRAKLLELGGFDETVRCAVDCDMWIRWSFHVPMVLEPAPLVLRRVHPGALSGDRGQDAEDWLRILDRLARDHPEFPRDHRWVFRRALGKQRLRYGRELLARGGGDRERLRSARLALARSVAAYPFFLRAYLYLLWSFLSPSAYARFRAWERKATAVRADQGR